MGRPSRREVEEIVLERKTPRYLSLTLYPPSHPTFFFFFGKKTTIVLLVTHSLLLLIDTRRQSFDCQILPAVSFVQPWAHGDVKPNPSL